ncbi:MAG: flagellar filament capping protein FliD [Oscillospiraceae bacterium]|nr:flagellar filament capping protein FliD [Oscillospiraceae bacterium]
MSIGGGFFNTLASRHRGIGGLATGMDTEALIHAMTTATRTRLARQQQERTMTTWRIEAFRNTRTELSQFRDRNLTFNASTGGTTNIRGSQFFNTFNTSVNHGGPVGSNPPLNVRTTANSVPGTFRIDQITQLATNQTLTTRAIESPLTGGEVSDFLNQNLAGQTLTIQMGTTPRTIQLDSLSNTATAAEFQEGLQTLITQAFGTRSATQAEFDSQTIPGSVWADGSGGFRTNAIQVDTDTGEIVFNGHANRLEIRGETPGAALGFTRGHTNRVNMGSTVRDFFGAGGNALPGVTLDALDRFQISVNDVVITVNATDTMSTFLNRINSSAAGVNVQFNVATQQFTFSSLVTGEGDNIRLRDVEGNLLHAFVGAPSGNVFQSTGNFEQLNVTSGESINNMLNTFIDDFNTRHNADNPERLAPTWNSVDSRFEFTYPVPSGMSYNTFFEELAQLEFRLQIGDGAGTLIRFGNPFERNTSNTLAEDRTAFMQESNAGNVDWDDVFADAIQRAINTALPSTTNPHGVTVGVDGSGHLTFNSSRIDQPINLRYGNADHALDDRRNLLGRFDIIPTTASTDTAGDTPLSSLGITTNGSITISVGGQGPVTLNYQASWTVEELIDAINTVSQSMSGVDIASLHSVTGRIVIEGGSQGIDIEDDAGDLISTLFAGSGGQLYSRGEIPAGNAAVAGQNAEIIMDGKIITSNTNTFEVLGTLFDVTAVTTEPPFISSEITFTVAADADALVENIRGFIEQYNEMIDYLHNLVNEPRNRAFPPLTEEQRADMTRDEIERWEEEARKGVVQNDPTIRRILNELRATLFLQVEGTGLSLMDIGISTESTLTNPGARNNGRIELDENRLRQMIDNNPEAVRNLFQAHGTQHDPRYIGAPRPGDPPRTGLGPEITVLDENGRVVRTYREARDGLGVRLERIIQDAIRIAPTHTTPQGHAVGRGSLVTVAGTDAGGNPDATLVQRMRSIDDRISQIQARLEREFNRLWSRFARLETSIQRLTAQGGWLEQFSMDNR